MVGGGQEAQLGFIELKSGKGMLQLEVFANNICQGISYDNLETVRIPIGAGRELLCQVEDKQIKKTNEVGFWQENTQKANWESWEEKPRAEGKTGTEEKLSKAEAPDMEENPGKQEKPRAEEKSSTEEKISNPSFELDETYDEEYQEYGLLNEKNMNLQLLME